MIWENADPIRIERKDTQSSPPILLLIMNVGGGEASGTVAGWEDGYKSRALVFVMGTGPWGTIPEPVKPASIRDSSRLRAKLLPNAVTCVVPRRYLAHKFLPFG